jgi:hypothetical protein
MPTKPKLTPKQLKELAARKAKFDQDLHNMTTPAGKIYGQGKGLRAHHERGAVSPLGGEARSLLNRLPAREMRAR